jgi:hypothetical protein
MKMPPAKTELHIISVAIANPTSLFMMYLFPASEIVSLMPVP